VHVPDAKGFLLSTRMGMVPGMSAFATHMMKKEMEEIDIPPVSELNEMISDLGDRDYFHVICPIL